ncbi:unnamed protein product [Caenorhabditis sp. 36 PRJEB53466]|nr:unnamed protein product [Caenorhabditis sp. 36 PRJEB53466]
MFVLVPLAVFLLIPCMTIAQSQCVCYEESKVTTLSAVLCNAHNNTDFSACYSASCSFEAYPGDESFIWTGLNVRWSYSGNSGGLLQFFDSSSDSTIPFIEVSEGQDVVDGDAKNLIKSTSATILVKYTQTGAVPNKYLGVIHAVPASGISKQ